MNPLFLHDWAEKNPSHRWPVVYVLLLGLILVGCSIEAPEDMPGQMPLTREQVHGVCQATYPAGADLIETKEGHLICRPWKAT